MVLIICVTIAIYALFIAWTWNNLEDMEKTKKILIIAIGLIIIYIITLCIFNFSKNEIQYPQKVIEENIRNSLVMIFTGVNSIIILPFIAKLIIKVRDGEIEKKYLYKKLIIIIVIFFVCIIFECGYMHDTQQGILKILQGKGL